MGQIRVLLTQLQDPVCSKVVQYDSGFEFCELRYWILVPITEKCKLDCKGFITLSPGSNT